MPTGTPTTDPETMANISAVKLLIRSLLSDDPSTARRARELVELLTAPPVSDETVEQKMPITTRRRQRGKNS